MKKLFENFRRFLIESKLVSKFALVLEIEPPVNIDKLIEVGKDKFSHLLPEGEEFTKITGSHVTLISGKVFKTLDETAKQAIVSQLETKNIEPQIDTSNVYLATREKEGRKTLYVKVLNDDQINNIIGEAFPQHNMDRYLHLSIANVHKGNRFMSIGNIVKSDENPEGKIIVPIPKKQPKKVKAKPKGQDNPVEFAKNLNKRGLPKEKIKDIIMKKFRKNEKAALGIMRGAGIA